MEEGVETPNMRRINGMHMSCSLLEQEKKAAAFGRRQIHYCQGLLRGLNSSEALGSGTGNDDDNIIMIRAKKPLEPG